MDEQQTPRESGESPGTRMRNASKRSYVACERCHKNKTKCNGETPCRNCQQSRKPTPCVYPIRDRKIPVAESYVKTLEEENRALKRKRSLTPRENTQELADNSNLNRDPSARISSPRLTTPIPQPLPHTPDIVNSSTLEVHNPKTDVSALKFVSDEIVLQPRFLGEASSETFAGRLQQYINHGERRPRARPHNYYNNPKLLRISCTDCNLPNKNYARLLVRAVLRFIGGDHHLLLKKSFIQRLDETYQLDVLDDPLWLCRLFTVLALGELYSARGGQGTNNGNVPGTDFFVRAMGYFQDLHEEPTVPYIETLLLLSFYSVALNRLNTAYTYTGLALRLSLTLGLHRKISKDTMTAPEREHRVRVWWTCYALDRIYTSKLGLPVMIRDDDIDVQMPSMDGLTSEEAEDFYTPELMTAQVKLARITGNAIMDVYRIPQPGRNNTFVQSVQRILTSLRAWHEALPQVLRLDFNAMPVYPSRSVASLHLHFGNTVIQTTRPILFHLFRSRFTHTSGTTSPRDVSPITTALGEACIQAARTSSSILAQLWVDGCLAPYGYFDALSVFASTMILMMSSAMKENDSNDNDAVETAWSLLRSMREAGNIPARGYYDHLTELRTDIEFLRAKTNQQRNIPRATGNGEVNGLEILLAASTSFNERQIPRLGGASDVHREASVFGVGDAVGALDDPFLQDFLQQTYRDWPPETFGEPPHNLPPGHVQFDWENANLFGSI